MNLPITSLTAGLLALLFLRLSLRTIKARKSAGIGIGNGDSKELARAARVHGNFAEYVPMGLFLVLLAEVQESSPVIVAGLALLLLIGRGLHAYGVSQELEDLRFRIRGMKLTVAAIFLGALNAFYELF